MTAAVLSIGELSALSGVSAHTIRFYESRGLLRAVSRASNGHRRYSHADVAWLAFVLRLKSTDMPLADIKRYAELRALGNSTLQPRLTMLKQHRERLQAKLVALTDCAQMLDNKIDTYQADINEKGSSTHPRNQPK